MKQLFPPEIIQNSAENFYFRQQTTSRVVYLILLLILIIFLVLLPTITIDITSQNNGVVRSRYDDNILQSAVYGEIVTSHLSENVAVRQGDTLIEISTQKTDEQINYYKLQVKDESIHLNDLKILLNNNNSRLASTLFRQESAGFQGKLEEQKVRMSQIDKEFILAKKLYEKNVIPKMEYEEKKNNLEYEKSHYNNICEQQKLTWQTRFSELRLKIEGLKSNIAQLQREKKQYIITAPISGTITAYSGIREGNFIVPNQQIARISPDDELLVECYVSPSNIGLIHLDMDVQFQFHSFNYNQWGIGSGKVTELSSNVININDQPYFKVRCSLDRSYLSLKNGYKGYLKKGMTLTGRFMITKRSLFQLLYDKTDNWLNPKIIENER
ncbi:MAG: HlyD family efflux transporter periplasmic adaptor subunit [Bacteroidia bacterium]|nr:HlyD family efflux transporter periplasmic adaptor subunit [Bacteroidia bacterium]